MLHVYTAIVMTLHHGNDAKRGACAAPTITMLYPYDLVIYPTFSFLSYSLTHRRLCHNAWTALGVTSLLHPHTQGIATRVTKTKFRLFPLGLGGWIGRESWGWLRTSCTRTRIFLVGDDDFLHPFPSVTCPPFVCIYGVCEGNISLAFQRRLYTGSFSSFFVITVARQSRAALGVRDAWLRAFLSFPVVYSECNSFVPTFVSRVYDNNRDYGVEKGNGNTCRHACWCTSMARRSGICMYTTSKSRVQFQNFHSLLHWDQAWFPIP